MFDALPAQIQTQARQNFAQLRENSGHPSLHFKLVKNGAFRSARVGMGYRAVGVPIADGVRWFWIGSHADYDRLLG